jgi:hypothetical protein
MDTEMTSSPHISSSALIHRIRYRHGVPFTTSVALATIITGWPVVFGATSIWTFALLALVAAAFTLLYGGSYRTFFITIAVTPPFFFVVAWFLRLRSAMPDFPSRGVSEYFLCFVAAPILLVWVVATLSKRKERSA